MPSKINKAKILNCNKAKRLASIIVLIFILAGAIVYAKTSDKLSIEKFNINVEKQSDLEEEDLRYYEILPEETVEIIRYNLKNYEQEPVEYLIDIECVSISGEECDPALLCKDKDSVFCYDDSLYIDTISKRKVEGHTNAPLLLDIKVKNSCRKGRYLLELIAKKDNLTYASADFYVNVGYNNFRYTDSPDDLATLNILYFSLALFSILLSLMVFILILLMRGKE